MIIVYSVIFFIYARRDLFLDNKYVSLFASIFFSKSYAMMPAVNNEIM